jgi:NitT/TauT family transport system substrate-binding protein/sulfonate transport system substrate-binding protein
MIRRRFVGAGLAAAIACLGAGAAAQQPLEIRVGAAQASDHAPVFAAVERGIFARHGLTARVVMYPTGVEMINGLLAGAQEVNVMGSIPFLAGVANGQPLVLIGHLHGDALRDHYADNNSIVARAGSGIAAVAGLRGKRIGLPRGTGAEGYLLGILSQNGMSPSDVTLVNIGPANLVTGLRQGDVDAIAIWEPVASAAALRVAGATRIIAGGCPTCYDPGTVLTTRAVIAQRAEQLRRFWLAFAEAEQWVRQNPDAAAEINMRWIQGIDLDIMKSAIRRSHYDPRLSRLTGATYNARTIPALLADRRLPRSFDANSAIDPQFYLHAQRTAPQFFADLAPIPEPQQLQ